jgi:ubiquinone biosynthesis protein UbiJ
MSDEIDGELQRQIELWQQDETDEDGQIETDAAFLQQILQQVEIWQTDSGAPEELPDGEIDAELLQKIADWQRADKENELARIEADARAARELDELLDRLRNEPSDL